MRPPIPLLTSNSTTREAKVISERNVLMEPSGEKTLESGIYHLAPPEVSVETGLPESCEPLYDERHTTT